MQYSSRTIENVLDLLGGSGSTLMGAEQTGRHAFLMELLAHRGGAVPHTPGRAHLCIRDTKRVLVRRDEGRESLRRVPA